MLKKILFPLMIAGVAIASTIKLPPTTHSLKVLIPLYIYPTPYNPATYDWLKVASAQKQVAITAVINPNSGPGGGPPNQDYAQGLEVLRSAGVQLLGYVSTRYGDRPISEVKADIDLYENYYGINGIFLDEAASQANQLNYYTELYQYIKAKNSSHLVVLNQGTQPDEGYLSRPAADIVVIFENYSTAWNGFVLPNYIEKYHPEQFAALIHSTASAPVMEQSINLARDRNIGYIYITDDSPDSSDRDPWNRLPSYWNEELTHLQQVNQTPDSTGR